MGLETGTYVNDLNSSNPVTGDNVSQGDDHLRLLKAVLKATFPNADKAFYFPDAATKTADFTIAATDLNKTYYVSTASGNVTATLPTLSSSDDGWECHFIKTNTGTNPLFIAPASGTLQSGEVSGLSKCRRCIPGHRTTARWSGTAWYVSRVPSVPIGSTIEFHGASLPVGYEWPNGQTLSSASTNYPEYYSVNGSSGVVPDQRGRAVAGKDNMGGSAASRLTSAGSGVDGSTLSAVGGAQTVALDSTQNGPHQHTGTTDSDGAHYHFGVGDGSGTTLDSTNYLKTNRSAGAVSDYLLQGEADAPPNTARSSMHTGHTHAFTTATSGSGSPHNNVQPTIVQNKLVVVE